MSRGLLFLWIILIIKASRCQHRVIAIQWSKRSVFDIELLQSTTFNLQCHTERMTKVKRFSWAQHLTKNGFSHHSIMGIALSWSFAEGWFMAQGTDASLMWYDGLKEVRSEWLISDFWIPLYQTDCTLSSAELFLLHFLRPCMSKIKCLFVLKITNTV